jgi:Bacterial transcriptional activator domain
MSRGSANVRTSTSLEPRSEPPSATGPSHPRQRLHISQAAPSLYLQRTRDSRQRARSDITCPSLTLRCPNVRSQQPAPNRRAPRRQRHRDPRGELRATQVAWPCSGHARLAAERRRRRPHTGRPIAQEGSLLERRLLAGLVRSAERPRGRGHRRRQPTPRRCSVPCVAFRIVRRGPDVGTRNPRCLARPPFSSPHTWLPVGTEPDLMLALHHANRRADALEAYQRAGRPLVDNLGLEPDRQLQHLQRAVLAGDPALDLAPRPTRSAAPHKLSLRSGSYHPTTRPRRPADPRPPPRTPTRRTKRPDHGPASGRHHRPAGRRQDGPRAARRPPHPSPVP